MVRNSFNEASSWYKIDLETDLPFSVYINIQHTPSCIIGKICYLFPLAA